MLVGVDGGASGVRAYEVVATRRGFVLGAARASRTYPRPEAAAMVEAAAQCIEEVAGGRRVACGICMPGLKTADLRGVEKMRNGPPIPDFLDRLEARLDLVRPVVRLESDGFAGGVGEELAGLFRRVESAYYLGGGTGLAECLKLDGRVRALDELGLPRAWELGMEDPSSAEVLANLIRLRIDAVGELERVVLAQRLGPLFDGDEAFRRALDGLPVVASGLREAPGLGAAALAYGWQQAE